MATDARLLSSPKNCLWPNGSHLIAAGQPALMANSHGVQETSTRVTCGASHCPGLLPEEADSIFQPRVPLDHWIKRPGAVPFRGERVSSSLTTVALGFRASQYDRGTLTERAEPLTPAGAAKVCPPRRHRPCCCHTSCPDPGRHVARTPGLCWHKT